MAARTTCRAVIADDSLGDNRGGISPRFAAVAEPTTRPMMLFGTGGIGGTMRRRRARRIAFA